MNKVCVVGHFGHGENLLNGQTVKTKILTTELQRQYSDSEVVTIDTHGGIKALIKGFGKYVSAFKNCENIVMLPAENGLRLLAPMFIALNNFYHRRLHYVVVGGWLPDYISDKKGLSEKLKRFDWIYVEANRMKQRLESVGFSNVLVAPNCKELQILSSEELIYDSGEPYRLCTFSRVMKEKGIEDAVNAVITINKQAGRMIFCLDIYGQIDSNQVQWFEALKYSFPEYINYGGTVPFNQSTNVLKDYHALLFPTFYEGEGFAGTLIDAMAAGVPVIASDWKYNAEVVEDGITGLLYKTGNKDQFIQCLIESISGYRDWKGMKLNSIQRAEEYLPENALTPVFEKIS